MISTYFVNKTSLDDIEPVIDLEVLRNSSYGDFWYLKSHETPYWVWNDSVFSEAEINKIRQIGGLLDEEIGLTGGYILENKLQQQEKSKVDRKSKISWVNMNKETEWIYQRLTKIIIETNETWWNFDLTKIERLQYTRYYDKDEGFYTAHVDPMNGLIPDDRKLSFVIQLSEPDEYEGGQLLLYKSSKPDVIPKKKGYTIFFPSHTLHEVTPVTKGFRQSLVGWIHGPKLR